MSEQPKKARDIKDLKARLGRTSPQQGGTPSNPAQGASIPAPLPMPAASTPGIPRGAEVPAPFAQRPSIAQPGRSHRPPADPFAPPSAPFPSPSGAPPRASIPADPFAAAPQAAAPREVRLVIDDKAVDEAEVGRRSSGKFIATGLVAAIVGAVAGMFIGSTWGARKLYDVVLQDAKDIYGSVNKASSTVEASQRLLDQAVKAAAPGAGKTIEIDFKAIEDLRKLEKPFPADVFSRKHYRAFESATVDQLFQYYNNTNQLWTKLASISAKALPTAAREALVRSAKSAGDLATVDYGCVPFKAGDAFGCGIVAVTRGPDGKLMVTVRGTSYEKTLYAGQELGSKTSDYVIMIDKGRSNEALGAGTTQFQSFARDLMEAKTLADQTVDLQGRLIKQLGEVAKLQSLN